MSFISIPALIRGRHIWDEYQFPTTEFEARKDRLRLIMKDEGFDGLLIFADSLSNGYVSYLSFYNSVITWTNALLMFPADGNQTLFASVPPRDRDRIGKFIPPGTDLELAGLNLVANDHIGAVAAGFLNEKGLLTQKWAGVNLGGLPHKAFSVLHELLGEIPDFTGAFDSVRSQKSPAELSAVCQAAAIAKRTALNLARTCRPGVSERDAVFAVDKQARYDGAEDVQILVGGTSSVSCLHFPGDAAFSKGDLVKVYVDVQYLRYHGLYGFSFAIGGASDEQQKILDSATAKFRNVASALASEKCLPANYLNKWELDPRSFSSVNGIGLDQVEAPAKGLNEDWRLQAGNVLSVAVEHRDEHGDAPYILTADTFYMSPAALISASGGC